MEKDAALILKAGKYIVHKKVHWMKQEEQVPKRFKSIEMKVKHYFWADTL